MTKLVQLFSSARAARLAKLTLVELEKFVASKVVVQRSSAVTFTFADVAVLRDAVRLLRQGMHVAWIPNARDAIRAAAVNNAPAEVRRLPVSAQHAAEAANLCSLASAIDEHPATLDEAEELYRRVVDLDPHYAAAWTNLGNLRFRRGDEHGACVFYKRALELDPKQTEALDNLILAQDRLTFQERHKHQ